MSAPAAIATADLDAARTARLLFDAELLAGTVDADAVTDPAVLDALRPRAVPGPPVRLLQDGERKLGRLSQETAVAAPLAALRRAVLGSAAAAPPRFLVRVDEFPHYRAWDEPERYGSDGFRRFHEIAAGAGVHYLVAALPRVSQAPLVPAGESRPLEDREAEILRTVADEGVALGLHGRDHRTRFRSPRRHSELCGLDLPATVDLLDEADAALRERGLEASAFVPPYNRFDAAQMELLAGRYGILCGGPESIRKVGFHRTPEWRRDGIYLPSYAPFYGRARDVLPAAERSIERATGLWTPIVLHWGWEADDGWQDLERLCRRIGKHTARWQDLSAAVERSR